MIEGFQSLVARRNAVGSQAYRKAVLADSPTAYWRLGESSGTVAADEMGSFNGTYIGSPTLGVGGIFSGNRAIQLNGTTQSMSRASSASLEPGAGDFSLELWFKLDTSALQTIASKGNGSSASAGYSIFHQSGFLYVRCNAENNVSYRSQQLIGGIVTGQWYHVVLVINRTTERILGYLNGSNTGWSDGFSASLAGFPAITNSGDFYVGYQTTPLWFDGTVDEAAIYPTALSASRIAAHYAAAGY